MTSVFDQIGHDALSDYLSLARQFKEFNVDDAYKLALQAIRYYSSGTIERDALRPGQELERRWYESLAAGEPDYNVYDDVFFVSDVWACWIVYSRKYLMSLRKMLNGTIWHTIAKVKPEVTDVHSVIDLGCGVGYTTAALKELFPNAVVRGTNIPATFQYSVAQAVGMRRDFTMQGSPQGDADLVFAAEYFEHFQKPTVHLCGVLAECNPKYLIVANSFGSTSVGHFDEYYDHYNRTVHRSQMGRVFNRVLRDAGYDMIDTNFWNNRPTIWQRR